MDRTDLPLFGGRYLLLKGILATGAFLFICSMAQLLGHFFTFLLLDVLLSVYLFSLFRNRWRLLFLVHPIVVYFLGFGFQTPFTEIGTGWTYLRTYDHVVDPVTLEVDLPGVIFFALSREGGYYGIGGGYVETIPLLLFPHLLYINPPDITFYYSLSLWTLICVLIGVNAAMVSRIIREEVLLIIALYATVSPMFFDINSSLHRYHVLVLGVFLFLIAYLGITRKRIGVRTALSIGLMLISVMLVFVSKAPLLLSLLLFVFLDYWGRGKLPIISSILDKLGKTPRILVILIAVVAAESMAHVIVPDKYVIDISQRGGQYQGLSNIPIVGLLLRVVYAVLSPFPWINFAQWELYGGNKIFLLVHMLSALTVSWIVLSLFIKIRSILRGSDDIRTCVMLGIALMASLAYAGIGWHVYLAPAMPFLATLLYERGCRISYLYPFMFVIVMEIVAQTARFLR